MKNGIRLLGFALGVMTAWPTYAQETGNANTASDAIAMNYVGDEVRIGIGYDSETDLTGEFFWVFSEQADSAWLAEGWMGNDGSGGFKLNYHWLSGGVENGQDIDGQTVYSDGRVRKLFLATDRNIFDDAKLTFGGGSEHDNKFWSLYASKSITGKRFLGQSIDIENGFQERLIDNHAWTRLDTWTTITDFYAHPYEWGLGFRIGRHFEDTLVRMRSGFDYELGDYDSSQLTAYVGLEKRFQGSAHGISLRGEVLRKGGDFEIDKNDARFSVAWTLDFGTTFRPARSYRKVQSVRIPDPSELPRKQVVEVVKNQVTLDNKTSFELDSNQLNETTTTALKEFLGTMESASILGKIAIIGHTCSLGSDEYNQTLSEQRAKTVFDFLVAHGVDAAILEWQGRGEQAPRHSNDSEETRSLNRRVEIAFTSSQEVVHEVIVGEGEPITEWVQETVPVEAAWVRRALRNPVSHKRSVDYYRYNEVTEEHEFTETFANEGPVAANDQYTVLQNSTDNILNIVANDSDPEGDNLSIVSLGTPAHGTAAISGNTVSYTPQTEFYGTDSFSYVIEDPYGEVSSGEVNIVVERLNEAPAAEDDQYNVLENSESNIFEVLANDSDPDGDELTIVSVSPATSGTASIGSDTITYTPNPGYFGSDSFQYTIRDGYGEEDTAVVTVTVEEVNSPPVAVDDSASTLKNQSVDIDLLANDYDPDGDSLSVTEIIQAENKMGHVVNHGDGTVTYTPMAGWWGGDSFQYRISDGRGGSATATVALDVK